jgi:hypothetical protein
MTYLEVVILIEASGIIRAVANLPIVELLKTHLAHKRDEISMNE